MPIERSGSKDLKAQADENKRQDFMTSILGRLNSKEQFFFLCTCTFVLFGTHNYLQEAIMRVEGFKENGWSLGLLEVTGITLFSFLETVYVGEIRKPRASPLNNYIMLTIFLLLSSSLSYISLGYINYPTKVIFRSCKLIPVMFVAVLINGKKFSALEYAFAFMVCTGLILFGMADFHISEDSKPIGFILVSLSVFAEAMLPNMQEKVFKCGATRLELTFWSNIFTTVAYFSSSLATGDLVKTVRFVSDNTGILPLLIVYTSLAYFAIATHMAIVKKCGGVIAVLIGNSRKAMTICLSFLLFPKPFSWYYLFGGLFVLVGLTGASLLKQRNPSNRKNGLELKPRESKTVSSENIQQIPPAA